MLNIETGTRMNTIPRSCKRNKKKPGEPRRTNCESQKGPRLTCTGVTWWLLEQYITWNIQLLRKKMGKLFAWCREMGSQFHSWILLIFLPGSFHLLMIQCRRFRCALAVTYWLLLLRCHLGHPWVWVIELCRFGGFDNLDLAFPVYLGSLGRALRSLEAVFACICSRC